MRILITGGAGFLGSHLCQRFIKLGHEVVCIDNLMIHNNLREELSFLDADEARES
jgi:nucleoside-diphosphate-sugar epimerase